MTTKVADSLLVDGPTFSPALVFIPTDGSTVTITPDCTYYRILLVPAANLAALTLTPTSGSVSGQTIEIAFGKNVTTLTFGAGVATTPLTLPSTIAATLAAPVKMTLAWQVATGKWIKV